MINCRRKDFLKETYGMVAQECKIMWRSLWTDASYEYKKGETNLGMPSLHHVLRDAYITMCILSQTSIGAVYYWAVIFI